MTPWLAIISLPLGIALLIATFRKLPDPKHKFMLDLYQRMLGPDIDQLSAPFVEHSKPIDQLRRVG